MSTTSMQKKVLGLAVVLVAFALAAPPADASSLRSDLLSLLPQETGEIGFIDLRELRASPHYRIIRQRLMPRRLVEFERFVRSTGVNVEEDTDWLAWALLRQPGAGELFLGLVQGQFSPQAVEDYFRQRELPLDTYRGQTLFPFGAGRHPQALLFTFLDASTAAFGTRRSLELMLETRFGTHPSIIQNQLVLDRLYEANGHAPIWVVLDDHYTQLAVRQLVPEAAKFDQFKPLAQGFRAALMTVRLARELTLNFQATCARPADAQTLSFLLQTGLTALSWQTQKKNPELSAVLH
ncbi:MAG: hypothetical protein ACE5HB_07185, partial [Terriglobia bacterium]